MKKKKSSGKGNPAATHGSKDLPPTKTSDPKGGANDPVRLLAQVATTAAADNNPADSNPTIKGKPYTWGS